VRGCCINVDGKQLTANSACVVDTASNFAADFLQRILSDIGRHRDRKDALGGRGYPVNDVRQRPTVARRSNIRACQSGKQLCWDVSRCCRLSVRRAHQFPIFLKPRGREKLDAAARRQQSSDTRTERHREICVRIHAAVWTSCCHRHRQRRLVTEECAGSHRSSSRKWHCTPKHCLFVTVLSKWYKDLANQPKICCEQH